jgi:hypothetical protein
MRAMEKINIPKLTGFVICYAERADMEKVHARLKDLKSKDPNLKDVGLNRAYNHKDNIPYPWTIALIVTDATKLKSLDDYLTDSMIDLGEENELFAGEHRIQDFFRMLPLDGKYEPGIVRIKTGTCPMNAKSPMACTFCMVGHMLECHAFMTCEQAKCSHLAKNDEDAI